MAKFTIYSKDGKDIRYTGCPKYNGAYLKVSFLDFGNISVSENISWQVGDYVDYTRTGKRYRLYSQPTLKKQSRTGTSGEAFVYQGVQLYAKTHDLEIAPFRDYVKNDNGIHFSTRSAVNTYENVYGIIERIQKNLDVLFSGEWIVRVYENLEEDSIKKITESQNFSVEGNCLDACNKLYELWGIGWLHVVEGGKDILVFGKPNKRESNNTSDVFIFGKGNGLTAIQKSASNQANIATRLYVYGSTRNMLPRYYNGLSIKDAESVDIQHLMIPLEYWGKTNGLPDASKAYIENSASISKLGLIPKSVYFNGGDYQEIYPTISGVTINDVRKVISPEDKYYPKLEIYDGSERIDKVKGVVNPQDVDVEFPSFIDSPEVIDEKINLQDYQYWFYEKKTLRGSGLYKFRPTQSGTIRLMEGEIQQSYIDVVFMLNRANGDIVQKKLCPLPVVSGSFNTDGYDFWIEVTNDIYEAGMTLSVGITLQSYILFGKDSQAYFSIDGGRFPYPIPENNGRKGDFQIYVRQLGFDINKMTALASEGKCTVAINTGMCSGRQFPVVSAKYRKETDDWELGLNRQEDKSLGEKFPNSDYPIKIDDEFVLLDLAMPKIYISLAEQRLYKRGMELYDEISRISPYYEPSIDPIVMVRSGRCLSEGMYMHIQDEDVVESEGGNDYILIDTLTISEYSESIPTYKVTLREKKQKSFQERTKEAISDLKDKTSDLSASGKINTEYANRAGSADFAYNAEKWAGYRFSDLINQPVRKEDNVQFASITSNEVVSTNHTSGVLGAGYKLWSDEKGSNLDIDNILVRKTMTVFEMLIQQIQHQGGIVLYTAASIKCTKVEDTEVGYKCYFDTKGGSLVNLFVVGDQARCQRFDSENTQKKYYWRYVTEIGEDYIILSKSDCDEGSDIPEEGDNIVQLGHRTDAKRMAAKMSIMVGDNTPRDEYYEGINSYNLSDKLVTVVGVKDGKVGVFTENGIFKGNVHIGSGSSGLSNLREWKEVEKVLDGINQDTILEPFEKASIRTEWIAINGIESTTEGSTSGSYYNTLQAISNGELAGVSVIYKYTTVSDNEMSPVYSVALDEIVTTAYRQLRSYLNEIELNNRDVRYEGFDRPRLSELLKVYYDAERLVRDRKVSDLEYIEELFPKGNIIAEGAIFGKLLGVVDSNENILAGLNGTDLGRDSEHGKALLFAGSKNVHDIPTAKTRIYEDGTIQTSSLEATKGKIGGFDLDNWLSAHCVLLIQNKQPLETTDIYFNEAGLRYNYAKKVINSPLGSLPTEGKIETTDIRQFNLSMFPPLSAATKDHSMVEITKLHTPTSNTPEINKQFQNIGIKVDVRGANNGFKLNYNYGNYAIMAVSGMFAGFRPAVRCISESTQLTTIDHTIIIDCPLENSIVITLPTNAELGQEYEICTNGVNNTPGRHTLRSNKANMNLPYWNEWGKSEITFVKNSKLHIIHSTDRTGNMIWWIYDK